MSGYMLALFEKFPVFDPRWDRDMQLLWFDIWNRFMDAFMPYKPKPHVSDPRRMEAD